VTGAVVAFDLLTEFDEDILMLKHIIDRGLQGFQLLTLHGSYHPHRDCLFLDYLLNASDCLCDAYLCNLEEPTGKST